MIVCRICGNVHLLNHILLKLIIELSYYYSIIDITQSGVIGPKVFHTNIYIFNGLEGRELAYAAGAPGGGPLLRRDIM